MPIKSDDITLWRQWKRNKNSSTSAALVNQLLPIVKSDIYRYSSNIPYTVVEAHAKALILQAADNYNPNSGATLGTWVKSYIRKLNQLSDAWRSSRKIPANRAYKFSTFTNAEESLKSGLGREPTASELADKLRWSQAEVSRFRSEIGREFTEDRPFVSTYNPSKSKEEEMIDYIYHDLSSREKLLFEYSTGYGGRKKLSNPEIMKKMNMTQNQLSYEKKKLIDKIEGILAG